MPNNPITLEYGASIELKGAQLAKIMRNGRRLMRNKRCEFLKKRDFESYLFVTYGGHQWLRPFVKIAPQLSPRQYWKLLGDVWTHVEVTLPDMRVWLRLLQSKRAGRASLMTLEERRALAKLPDEFEIWRGCGHVGGVQGLSWTLDRKRAKFFAFHACGGRREFLAKKQHGSSPIVVAARCRKSDVLAHFTGRKESEIVVNPKNVTVLRSYFLHGAS